MRKRGLVCILVFSMMFCLAACGSKTAINTDTFVSTCQDSGLQTQDVSAQYAEYDFITVGTVALSGDWQIEFYEISDEDHAKAMFADNKSYFENSSGSGTNKSVNLKNYDMYSATSGDRFMYVARIDNTLIYVDADKEYKSDIKNVLDQLGY